MNVTCDDHDNDDDDDNFLYVFVSFYRIRSDGHVLRKAERKGFF